MREILFKRNQNNDKEAKKAKKSDLTINELRNTELPQLSNIVNFCANVPISLYSDTTIVKTPETCFRGLYYSTNRLAGEEFLLNYRRSNSDLSMVIGIKAYKSFQVRGAMANRPLLDEEVLQESLKLPPPGKLNVPLGPVIQSRRSKRNFSGKPIEMKDLSTLLFYCQGVSGIADISLDIEGGLPATKTLGAEYKNNLRNVSSGGAVYPIDLYLIVTGVEKLDKGIYKYLPNTHSLQQIRKLQESDISTLQNSLACFQGVESDKIDVFVIFVYNMSLNSRKYGDSGVAFALIEAGEIAQNIHLTSTALGLGPCDIGGYGKQQFEKFIGIDGLSKHMIHLTILGA
jgi:SagB-type dehydrogenase domain